MIDYQPVYLTTLAHKTGRLVFPPTKVAPVNWKFRLETVEVYIKVGLMV